MHVCMRRQNVNSHMGLAMGMGLRGSSGRQWTFDGGSTRQLLFSLPNGWQ